MLDATGLTEICSLAIGATGSGRQTLQINEDAVLLTNDAITISTGGDINLQGGELAGGAVTERTEWPRTSLSQVEHLTRSSHSLL